MKRLLLLFAAVAALALSGLVLGRHALADYLITRSFSKGDFRLSIGQVRFHPLRSSLRLSELTLYNPSGYPEPVAMRIHSLRLDYRLRSLIADEQQWPLVQIDVPEVHVVTLPDGRVNLEAFQEALDDGEGSREDEGEGRDYLIDTLKMKLGSLTMTTFAPDGAEPVSQVLNLDIDKTYHGVIDTQIVVDDLSQAMIIHLLPQMLGGLLGEETAGEVESLMGDIRDLGLGDLLDGPAEVTVPPRPRPSGPSNGEPDDLDELLRDF